MMLSLVGLVLGVIVASYAGINDRAVARTIIPARGGEAVATYLMGPGNLIEAEGDPRIVYLFPEVDSPPLPPGVDRFPGPGEAVLSPALKRALAEEGSPDRYGTVVGTIGPEGLESLAEMMAYVHPRQPATGLPIAGFGGKAAAGVMAGEQASQTANIFNPTYFVLGYLLFTVLPTLLLARIGLAGRIGERREQNTILATLGFDGRARMLWHLGSLARPWLAGIGVGCAALICTAMLDVRVPTRQFTVYHRDVLDHLPLVALATFLPPFALLIAALAGSSRIPKKLASNRPAERDKQFSGIIAACCALAGPVTYLAAIILLPLGDDRTIAFTYGAFIICLLTCYHLVGYLVTQVARRMEERGNRRGDPSLIGAGAGLSFHLRRVSSLAAILAGGIIVAWQFTAVAVSISPDQLPQHGEDDPVILSAHGNYDPRVIEHLTKQLPPGTEIVYEATASDESTRLFASPDGNFQPGGPTALGQALAVMATEPLEEMTVAELESELAGRADEAFVRVYAAHPDIDAVEVVDELFPLSSPAWQIETATSAAGSFVTDSLMKGAWLRLLAAGGIISLLLAVLASAASDVHGSARSLARLGALYGTGREMRRLITYRVMIPPMIGLAVGTLLGAALQVNMSRGYVMPGVAFFWLIALTAAITIIMCLALRTTLIAHTARETDRWKAGRL